MGAIEDSNQDVPKVQLKLWPLLVLAAIQLAAAAYSYQLAYTLMHVMLGSFLIPMGLTLALFVWWMSSRSIPLKQRLTGLAIAVAAIAATFLTHSFFDALFLLQLSLPITILGLPVVLLVTRRRPWHRQRLALAALIVGTPLLFIPVRVDGLNGDNTVAMSWRWTQSAEDTLVENLNDKSNSNRIASVSSATAQGDWPGFRGPHRDGRATGITFSTNWNNEPPTEIWRIPVGIGWSSFSIIGDFIFTQEQRGENEVIVCYDANTGDQIWTNSLPARFNDPQGSGPRATPTFHDGKLYTQGALGTLQCIDAANGETLWKREITNDANAFVPTWGFSASPLIYKNLVITFVGGPNNHSVLAYDSKTGDPAWQSGSGTHGYSSIQLGNIEGVDQLLSTSDFGIQSFTPESGNLLWEHQWQMSMDGPRNLQPLMVTPNTILLGSDGQGTRQIHVTKSDSAWAIQEQWTNSKFRPSFNDTVHHNGYAYGFDGRLFVCIDITTGERLWKSKRYGGQVLLIPDMDTLLILSNKGEVILIKATPEAHREIATLKALKGKTWNHPVIAHGKLFVRNAQEAACYQLPGWSTGSN